LFQIDSHTSLLEVAQYLEEQGIKFHLFFEPDDNMGYTSIATEPIMRSGQKKIFSKFKLYTFKGDKNV